MRVIAFAVLGLILGGIILSTTVLRPPKAADRLSGVAVQAGALTIDDLTEGRHRLTLSVTITSDRDIDECMAFTFDEPFAGRRLQPLSGECLRPRAAGQAASLGFDQLTDDDLTFPSHTLVWGVPGGRCGIVLELLGVCVVDMAGTAPVELPSHSVLPSFGPLGSFLPVFSFPPP
jgi:hypothetical protein